MPQKCYETHEGAFAIFLSHSLQGGMKDFLFFRFIEGEEVSYFPLSFTKYFLKPSLYNKIKVAYPPSVSKTNSWKPLLSDIWIIYNCFPDDKEFDVKHSFYAKFTWKNLNCS